MIESDNRRAMIDGNRQMQGVAGAQAERILIGEAGGDAELRSRDRQDLKDSADNRVKAASASARWRASIWPVRILTESAAENSVATHSLMVSSAGS